MKQQVLNVLCQQEKSPQALRELRVSLQGATQESQQGTFQQRFCLCIFFTGFRYATQSYGDKLLYDRRSYYRIESYFFFQQQQQEHEMEVVLMQQMPSM